MQWLNLTFCVLFKKKTFNSMYLQKYVCLASLIYKIRIHNIHVFNPFCCKSALASLICLWISSAAAGQSLNVNTRYSTVITEYTCERKQTHISISIETKLLVDESDSHWLDFTYPKECHSKNGKHSNFKHPFVQQF